MVLFKPNLDFEIESAIADKKGRYLLLKTNMFESSFLLSNIYAPNDITAQTAFFRNLDNILSPYADSQIILGGDLNCSLAPIDKTGGAPVQKKQKVIDEIEGLVGRFKLQDIWRDQHPNKKQYTWRDNSLKVQCRLDYWLVSKELPSAIDINIINPTISDHSAIAFTLQSKEYAKRGPGFWKINNSLLKDANFINELKSKIPEYKNKHSYLADKGLYWDMLKMEIRGFCVQYSKRKNRIKRNKERDLQKEIDDIMTLLQSNRSKENIAKLYQLRAKLNQIAEYKTEGAMIRSRIRWHEQGEKNTKYFLNLEKRRFTKTHITRLKTDEERETTCENEILEMQRAFYENLYAKAPCNSDTHNAFLQDPNLVKLEEHDLHELEQLLSKSECFNVLKQCAKNKCPGTDGLSVEFYLHFWHLLGEEMVESFNYAHKLGKLNITQRQGIIKVIPKKRKNRLYLENWRPLTLLNVDYKIATKSIAHRIAKVLPKLINEDQTGYVEGRYIGQNIRLINHIMNITELENIPGMAIFIDFKKAFDTVDWNFLFKTLEALNFGPQLQQWIRTFYADCSSCVTNNGYASAFFNLQRGVRQGCPLSGSLFVLCAEILANAIRSNAGIQGINIYGKEFKISQYADDTTVFVSDIRSAQNLFQLLDAFQNCSGLEVNKSKTEGMWLGANKNNLEEPLDITWPKDPILALGIHFSYDEEAAFQKNFEQKLSSMTSLLNLWYPRNLTLHGRIVILKALALSKLIYNTAVLPVTSTFIQNVNKVISQFVWRKKNPKIKQTTMIGPRAKGGLGMPDFDAINNALKATWIRRLDNGYPSASWTHIPVTMLEKCGGKFLLKCNFDLKNLNVRIPLKFYEKALLAWQSINLFTPSSEEEILDEILWNNRFIRIGKYSVYYKEWHEAGVEKIRDIFNGDTFTPYRDFCSHFALKTNFLTYYSLCQAIPSNWIKTLKGILQPHSKEPTNMDRIPLEKLSCKLATNYLVEKKFVSATAEKRLKRAKLNDQQIYQTYMMPFKATKDIQLSMFQFKIVHHILPTNAALHKFGIKEHDRCHLCAEKQTITHLFVTCPNVQLFWTEFTDWWYRKNNTVITLSEAQILYGITDTVPLCLGLNLCTIIAKYYIYTASKNEEDYFLDAFLAILKNKIEIETSRAKVQVKL